MAAGWKSQISCGSERKLSTTPGCREKFLTSLEDTGIRGSSRGAKAGYQDSGSLRNVDPGPFWTPSNIQRVSQNCVFQAEPTPGQRPRQSPENLNRSPNHSNMRIS